MKALVVDDENEAREAACQVLKKLGFDVKAAEGGVEGVEMAHAWMPDIIFADNYMPVVGGLAVCKIIASDKATAHIPVMVLSTNSAESNMLLAMSRGGGVIGKPLTAKRVQSAIESIDALRSKWEQVELGKLVPRGKKREPARRL